MSFYNIRDSKTHLSRLIEKALSGEDVIITRAGKPVARILPFFDDLPRIPGLDEGKVTIPPDFDAALPEFDQ